jgi:carbamoyl-phosphate synthase large subunit
LADRELTVLVLGVGGNVSQGILKALAISELQHRLVAACVDPDAPALFRADARYVSPPAADPGFGDWLVDVCEREGVDAVLSGVEPVLEALAAGVDGLRATCVVSPPEVLEVGQDKLLTCRWLEKQGFAAPRCIDEGDKADYPLIAKPRRGRSAGGVTEIVEPFIGRDDYVVQERLEGDEFTVGCFCDREGQLRGSVAMRRELSHGTTVRAECGSYPEVRSEAERMAEKLRPLGPLNVQLKLTEDGPVAFELNVRFSGTTPLRARLGFNEVEAALRHLVLGEPPVDLPDARPGVVVRYWNEAYVSDGEAFFEDWGVASNTTMSPRRDELR